jgi:hypothetical protein
MVAVTMRRVDGRQVFFALLDPIGKCVRLGGRGECIDQNCVPLTKDEKRRCRRPHAHRFSRREIVRNGRNPGGHEYFPFKLDTHGRRPRDRHIEAERSCGLLRA